MNGTKLKLASIPDEEWAQVGAEAVKFWDEIAAETPRTAKVVGILRESTRRWRRPGGRIATPEAPFRNARSHGPGCPGP